jgi:hypothetical protein
MSRLALDATQLFPIPSSFSRVLPLMRTTFSSFLRYENMEIHTMPFFFFDQLYELPLNFLNTFQVQKYFSEYFEKYVKTDALHFTTSQK